MIKYLNQPHINRLLNDPEQNFFDEEETKLLQVTMRIADEFYQFLLENDGGEFPPFDIAEYVVGTIRSGFDCFFDIRFAAQLVQMDPVREPTSVPLQIFREFKARYRELFNELLDPNISFNILYRNLILLWKLQVVFVGLVI
jgi:hypothetical protein